LWYQEKRENKRRQMIQGKILKRHGFRQLESRRIQQDIKKATPVAENMTKNSIEEI
jgi:hypothetical protein